MRSTRTRVTICYNSVYMADMAFDGQREGEKVEFIFRRHMATARKGVVWLIVMCGLGVVPMLIWKDNPTMFWVFIGFVVVGLIGLSYAYMLWYFSIYIVTDQRLRQVNQKGLFKKSVVDLGLDKMQSISYGVPGLFGGLFGYGTILIQTAVGDLKISMVAKPEKIYNELQNVAEGKKK